MKNYSKKAFTMVELIIVITILAVLGTTAYINFSGEVNDWTYSKDNTLYNQSAQYVSNTFIKDFAYDWTTDSDHKIRFSLTDGVFAVGTIDSSDSSDLTYAEAAQVLEDNIAPSLGLSATEFNVRVCDRDATDANLDTDINAATNGRIYELLVFTDENTTWTDCTWTITAGTSQLAGYTLRYKNAKLDGQSDDYDSDVKLDQWTRTSATAINTAWENTKWVFKAINSTLTVTNKGY